MTIEVVDTKLEALKLITDPSRLFALLFSKYGDIQDDYYIFISNQIIFNKHSHLNIFFKEQNTFSDETENINRFYKTNQSHLKILKLNEFYKNYQTFFCKATFSDIVISNLLRNYQDAKAEIFYKNNYGDSSLNQEEKSKIYNSSSLSSLDNITYNKTIFDIKNKKLIENEEKNKSISLTSDSFLKKEYEDLGLYQKSFLDLNNSVSNNGKNDSFAECLSNLLLYKKEKEKKQKQLEDNKGKNNDLVNLCKQVNGKIMNKVLNKKNNTIQLNKDNNANINNIKLKSKSKTNLPSLLNSPFNNKEKIQFSKNKKPDIIEDKKIIDNDKNNNNLLLSPRKKKFNFSYLTSRILEFKKFKSINIKSTKRNKSYHINNNNKNNQMISNNKTLNSNSNNSFNYNRQLIEYSINTKNNEAIIRLTNKTNKNLHIIKPDNSQISRYNKLIANNNINKNRKIQKNKTYELINNGKKIKNLSNKNILFNQFRKLVPTTSHRNNESKKNNNIKNKNGLKHKYTIFESGNTSPIHLNPIKRHNNKRHINILQTYNKYINKTKNLEQHKKFIVSSNSIDNNTHVNSLSPKSINSKISIKKDRKMNIQNNINIINKIKFPSRYNKNSSKDSNNNYNINFNNLFFYGPNTPKNYFDNIKNNIIDNQKSNMNINKINANFYLLSFNNLNNSNSNNSRNKIKTNNFSNNKSLNKIKIKTHNNNNNNIIFRKSESHKRFGNYKKRGLNLNEKKIPFTINKLIIGKENN